VPSLVAVPGLLVIQENNALEELSFPLITSEGFHGTIESNAALRAISLSNLDSLNGQLIVAGNEMLQEINLSSLGGMTTEGKLTITSNPTMTQLDFPSLECDYIFSIVLTNNTNLEGVYVPESLCLQKIVNEGNPKLVFYCNGIPC